MIHEYVHALLIFYYLEKTNSGITIENMPTYSSLADRFAMDYKIYDASNDPQHSYMSGLVELIADSTHTWAQSNGYSNIPLSYFKKLAWSGLEGSANFQEAFPNSSDRDEINQIIQSETFPNDASSNPLGNTCN